MHVFVAFWSRLQAARRLLWSLAALLALAAATHADDAILVLDASGSMWGQIDGQTKVEIARTVINGLLDELPADRRLGLVAYGHRREADCSDIEEVVPVGTDRAAIRGAVNSLGFKGRTPLSAAVKYAAERLNYSHAPASVILISDGVENCGLDPCTIGRELEAAGVSFTANVIGFGLASDSESAGLRCLAEATGGRYFAARNASVLAAALTATVGAVQPPVAPAIAQAVLRATELDGGPEIAAGLNWTIVDSGGSTALERTNTGTVEAEIPPGDYQVHVLRSADGSEGSASLEARPGTERTVTIPLAIDLHATVTPSPAASGPAGSAVTVSWTGPNRPGDYVTVVAAGAAPQEYLSYQNTERGNPAILKLPPEPGSYEIRYLLGRPQRVLAAAPFEVTEVTATLTAPTTGSAGSNIEIAWTGPDHSGDWITVVKPEADVGAYNDYVDADRTQRTLDLPVEPGAYEIRYVQAGRRIIARVPITVTAIAAEITAPLSTAAGASFEISWVGPNNHGDWLTIVAPDAAPTAYGSYADADRGMPATLRAPAAGGTYEVRYVLKGKKIIGRRTIEIANP